MEIMSRIGPQSSLCLWALSKAIQWELHWGKTGIVRSEICGSFSDSLVISSPQYWYHSVMFHTCWREKLAALLESMLFSQQSSHWTFMEQKIGVGPYLAGSSCARKIIGSSCCLGHEVPVIIHQLKCLASSSEKLSAHRTVPSWYYPQRAGLKGRDTVYPLSCSLWLRDDPGIRAASRCIFLVLQCLFHGWNSAERIYILLKPLASSLYPPALAATQ